MPTVSSSRGPILSIGHLWEEGRNNNRAIVMIEGRGVQRMIPSTVNHIRHGQPGQQTAGKWIDNKTKRRPAPALSPVTGNPVINHCYIWRCVIMCSKGGSHQHSQLSKSHEHMSGAISVSAAIACLFCVVNLFSNCYNQGPPAHICCLLSGSCKDAQSRHSIITHPCTNY